MTYAVSTSSTRRVHYQPQISNVSVPLNQTFSMIDSSNLNESFPSFIYTNPLVTIIYSSTSLSKDNQQILLNSYASCRRLLDHLKPVIGVQQDETIDLMDNEGKLKDLNTHGEEYASTYLTARNTYYVFKIEIDTATNEKRYIAYFNMDQVDQKLHSILNNSLNTLNSSSKVIKGGKRPLGTSKPNSSAQPTPNTAQTKSKKTSSRK